MLVTLLIGAVAVAAIERAGQESAAGGRTRATVRNLHAADSGIELARMRLSSNPPNTAAFSIVLEDGRRVESRRRTEATPQPLKRDGFGPPPEGYELNAGASSFTNEIFLINITSTTPAGTTTEIEAKILRLQAGTGG
jgi:type II secretory pathway pseudopilin PulG